MSIATSLNAADLLASTNGKANFQRLARLLVCGGTQLLREVFDSIHPPSVLPIVLNHPVIQGQLRWINQRERNCLYPSAGVYGKSTDFDVTLLYKLLKTICSLPAPLTTGWNNLPNSADDSRSADLARIRFYRNQVCHDTSNMEINDVKFLFLWQEITNALVRLAKSISAERETEWQTAIDKYLNDPLTPDDENNIEELTRWYFHDMEVKQELVDLKDEFRQVKESVDSLCSAGMVCLNLK